MWQKEHANTRLYASYHGHRHGTGGLGSIYEYSVLDIQKHKETKLEHVTWADFDQQKRLVLAKDGKLFSAAVVDGELVYTELTDFNANQPEAIDSPDWAKKW